MEQNNSRHSGESRNPETMDPGLKHSGMTASPKKMGFRMPAEWELHEATWLSWPHDLETWPSELPALERTYVEIIKQLHEGEKVNILVRNETEQTKVSKLLHKSGINKNIFFYIIPTNSPWIRDYGPTFISEKTNQLAAINWMFNAYGKKYKFDLDESVSGKIAKSIHVKEFSSDLIMEGGSIEVNGSGACIVTEECLLNVNRNPSLDQTEIERILIEFLNLKQIIWLGNGIVGDDTDGHVDELARFVSATTIVAALEEDSKDENYKALQDNWRRLQDSFDETGKKFNLIKLPMPNRVEARGKRFPASYANFYIGNQIVLVPQFGQSTDQKALGVLKEQFPDRKVIGINAIPLVYGQGAFHCITQQQPVANL